MATVLESTKNKIAKRVIEIFEFFDQDHQTATVMDIVRRYGRPQSSTSELLTSLVELGLLYKDPHTRSYWPTPRLAVMGANGQPSSIRDGRLFAFMDDLSRSTRHSLALFGTVGTHVQIFHWAPAPDFCVPQIHRGCSQQLSASAAGHLLLSTMDASHVVRLLRRLNAEAPQDGKFNVAELGDRIAHYGKHGHAIGASGFLPGNLVIATLLPCSGENRPLALGVFYPESAAVNSDALLGTLEHGIAACMGNNAALPAPPFMRAV